MKKFINNVEDVERQTVDGYVKTYPDIIAKAADDIVVRAHKKQGKVALVSGGGSGHEPMHLGFVGEGLLDATVGGAIFTSPAVDRVQAAIEAAAEGNTGVLLIITNYTGDIVNFKMAADICADEGIDIVCLPIDDDVAVEDPAGVGRRGVAGQVFLHKCAGAAAEAGMTLPEVVRVGQKVRDNVRTMGVAIEPCTVPAAGKPGFEIGEDEMEIGIGVHGEPGVRRGPMEPVDDMVDEILEKILADIDFSGSEVAYLVNGAGGTPPYELAIASNRVHDVLDEKGIKVVRAYMGTYEASLEMRGLSVSLLRLDDELKELLLAPALSPAFEEGDVSVFDEDETAGAASVVSHVAQTAAPAEEAPVADEQPVGEDTELVVAAIRAIAASMEEHKEELTELDGPIGDSDHGINMARGFGAASDQLDSLGNADASTILRKSGATVISKVGGSSGPLYGTLLRKVGAAVKKDGVSLVSFTKGLEDGLTGIEELAGAKPGDKTMLDAMEPAITSLKASLDAGTPAAEALDAAAKAAADGAEATIPLVAHAGRASYLGERSIGHKDPGAASFAYCMSAVASVVD